MTDNEIKKILYEMLEYFDHLPNPIHYPKQFEFYVKMYKHLKGI